MGAAETQPEGRRPVSSSKRPWRYPAKGQPHLEDCVSKQRVWDVEVHLLRGWGRGPGGLNLPCVFWLTNSVIHIEGDCWYVGLVTVILHLILWQFHFFSFHTSSFVSRKLLLFRFRSSSVDSTDFCPFLPPLLLAVHITALYVSATILCVLITFLYKIFFNTSCRSGDGELYC